MAGRGALAKVAASTFLRTNHVHRYNRRTFLSDEYRCQEAWNNRLNSPLLQKLKFDNFYVELMRKLQNEGKISAVDVDLCVQLASERDQLSNLEKLVNKFRRCPNTVYALPSMQHAVIRTFLEHKRTDTLLRMVDDRLNYGLFPDYYLSNLLMDSFLKEENFRDAVKVAIQLMLQEEYDNSISNQMSIYSCYAYLRKPQPEPWDPEPRPKPVEPEEVVKVRVDYIREPYFDEHFDLSEQKHLIGKTLVGFGKHMEGAVGSTSVLLGWTMFEKYDKVLAHLDSVLQSPVKPLIYKEWITQCQKLVQESTKLPDQFAEQFENKLRSLETDGFICDGDILEVIRQKTMEAVQQHQQSEIQKQLETYVQWDNRRQAELDTEVRKIERQKRLEILEAKKKELQEKEELLNFFDNVDQWELRYLEKQEVRQKREEETAQRGRAISSKQLRQAEEDSYVPPEVQKKHVKRSE